MVSYLSGLSLNTTFDQLSADRIQSHLPGDVQHPIYQYRLTKRQRILRVIYYMMLKSYFFGVKYFV